MTNKTVEKDLFSAQRLQSYGDSKCTEKDKENLIRFFGCSEEWYHFQQELTVSKMIV